MTVTPDMDLIAERLTYDIIAEIGERNVSCYVAAGATIDYGVRSPDARMTATTFYGELIWNLPPGQYPPIVFPGQKQQGYTDPYDDLWGASTTIQVGDQITIRTASRIIGGQGGFTDPYSDLWGGWGDFQSLRFTGYITAITYTDGRIAVTGVSSQELWARAEIDVAGWPQEDEADRVQRIADSVGMTINVETGGTGPTLAAYTATTDSDGNQRPQTVSPWRELQNTADSCRASIWIDRNGDIQYRAFDAPDGPTRYMPCKATLRESLALEMEVGRVVNTARVRYGDDNLTGQYRDDDSVTTYGERVANYTTILADEAQAQVFAESKLAALRHTEWLAEPVDIHIDAALYHGGTNYVNEILDADIDDVAVVGPLPATSPMNEYTGRIIGIRETLDPTDWIVRFYLDPNGIRRKTND